MRGIERGKCASGECEDFMRSDGAPCGYCSCLATRNSKKDARYSSDSVGSTSGSFSAAFQKWMRPKTLRIWNTTLIKIEILTIVRTTVQHGSCRKPATNELQREKEGEEIKVKG